MLLRWSGFWLLTSAILLRAAAGAPPEERAAPARAYFYLEPYSARFECLVRLPEMMALVGGPPATTLSPEIQQRLREAALTTAAGWLRVKIDGADAGATQVVRSSIVKGEPGRTEALQPDEIVPATGAMVGLVWEYDLPAVPQKIEFTWAGFTGGITSLTTSVIAGTQSEDHTLTAQSPSQIWENRGRLGLRASLAAVPPLPAMEKFHLPLGSIIWTILGLLFMSRQLRKGRKIPGRLVMTLMSILFGAAILWPVAKIEFVAPWGGTPPVAPDKAERILAPLLRNVYRAFDQRDESAIYDVLARSIEGELLQKVYLQTVNALTVDAQDATRVKVRDMPGIANPSVTVSSVRKFSSGRGFVAETQWLVTGTVGHWGHQHERTNRYTAGVTVEAVPLNGGGKSGASFAWKITALDIEEEKRL